jgi:hypothetical protein
MIAPNADVDLQRVDIGKEAVEKIIAEVFSLSSIESPLAVQMLERRRQTRIFTQSNKR